MRSPSPNSSQFSAARFISLWSRRSARSTANAFRSSPPDCRNGAHPMLQMGSLGNYYRPRSTHPNRPIRVPAPLFRASGQRKLCRAECPPLTQWPPAVWVVRPRTVNPFVRSLWTATLLQRSVMEGKPEKICSVRGLPPMTLAVMGWTPPRRPWCARVVVLVTTEQEASVSEASTIGLDLAKRVFQAHGADAPIPGGTSARPGSARAIPAT